MNTKFVIFVAIGSLLFAAIYGSSVSTVYGTIACAKSKDGKTAFCTDSVKETFYKCTKDKTGHWSCQDITPKEAGSTSIPSDLKKAMDLASGSAVTTTSPSKDLMSKKGELSNQEAQINQSQVNSSSDILQ